MNDIERLEKVRLNVYVGFDVIRHWFREKPDAEAYLNARMAEERAPLYSYYGVAMQPRVESSVYGGELAWEVLHG